MSRSGYAHTTSIPTRWADNDVYGHVNNVQYYAFFDTAINAWLIAQGGLDIHAGETIGLCAESHCAFRAAVSFPDRIEAALRVGHLGRSSVRYELALFRADASEAEPLAAASEAGPIAEGWFVHVFVDRYTRRAAAMPPRLREALERLQVGDAAEVPSAANREPAQGAPSPDGAQPAPGALSP